MLFLATATAAKHGVNPVFILLYFAVFGAMYFFYIRPRSQRQKAARQSASKVEVGDQVHTIGGLIGTVVAKSDDHVTLRTASGVELDFVSKAIARRVDPVVVSPNEGDQH
jgi:preprotein translocase subunit YajC